MNIKAVGSIPNTIYIGECIYCGSKTNLTREHIVPYGLGGQWIIHGGSCQECAKITSAFEEDVLRNHLAEYRATLGLPTYRKKNRPKRFDFQLLRDGQSVKVSLPVGECPSLIIMPHFKVPAYIDNYDYQRGLRVVAWSLNGPSNTREKLKGMGANGFSVKQNIVPVSFARMLAKIAFGMTILMFGAHALKEIFVLPCILGQSQDVGRWVGCSEEPDRVPHVEDFLHKIEINTNNSLVSARIRLFAFYKTPVYLVFVGSTK